MRIFPKWRAGTLLALLGTTGTWALLAAPGCASGIVLGTGLQTQIWMGAAVGNWNPDGQKIGMELGAFNAFPEPKGITTKAGEPERTKTYCSSIFPDHLANGRRANHNDSRQFQTFLQPRCNHAIPQ